MNKAELALALQMGTGNLIAGCPYHQPNLHYTPYQPTNEYVCTPCYWHQIRYTPSSAIINNPHPRRK